MYRVRSQAESRQRVSVACCACRKKRMRCDGKQPSCTQCLAKGLECEYQLKENKRRPPSKRYVESLQERIRVLEERLASLSGAVQQDSALSRSGSSTAETDAAGNGTDDDDDNSSSSSEGFINDITDTCGRLNLDEDGQLRFFGSQSNYHLLHAHINNQNAQNQRLVGVPSTRISQHVDVPLDVQEHLIDLYFRWMNPSVYLVDKDTFMRDYRTGIRNRYCTPLLLLSIFSVMSRFTDLPAVRSDPQDPLTAGNVYAEHAKALLLQELDTDRISTVQSVALLALRWMTENKEPAGWLYSGMATRMAFNLGLNLDCDYMVESGILTQEEADVRKVVWWGCYCLDKNFSLGLGRPGTTSDSDITCGKPRLCATAEFEPWLPSKNEGAYAIGLHSRVASLAHYACEHQALATQTLDMLYAPNSKLSKSDMAEIVSKADVTMNTFWATLPSFLRLPSTPTVPALPHVYQLHIQYHVSQILLHRPLISHGKSKPKVSGQQQGSSDDDLHLRACRTSASEITKLLQVYKRHYSLRFVVGGTVCHTFAAATIHLMDAKSRDPAIQQQGVRKLHTCISALHEIGSTWLWSFRAYRALQILANAWLTPAQKPIGSSAANFLAQNDGAKTPMNEQELQQGAARLCASPSTSELASFTGNFDPSMYLPSSYGSDGASLLNHIEDLDWLFNNDAGGFESTFPDPENSGLWGWKEPM